MMQDENGKEVPFVRWEPNGVDDWGILMIGFFRLNLIFVAIFSGLAAFFPMFWRWTIVVGGGGLGDEGLAPMWWTILTLLAFWAILGLYVRHLRKQYFRDRKDS
ncbi:membrane protein [Microbacterium phage Big4]|nr:membrane protein [Microbacterium phage Big4]